VRKVATPRERRIIRVFSFQYYDGSGRTNAGAEAIRITLEAGRPRVLTTGSRDGTIIPTLKSVN